MTTGQISRIIYAIFRLGRDANDQYQASKLPEKERQEYLGNLEVQRARTRKLFWVAAIVFGFIIVMAIREETQNSERSYTPQQRDTYYSQPNTFTPGAEKPKLPAPNSCSHSAQITAEQAAFLRHVEKLVRKEEPNTESIVACVAGNDPTVLEIDAGMWCIACMANVSSLPELRGHGFTKLSLCDTAWCSESPLSDVVRSAERKSSGEESHIAGSRDNGHRQLYMVEVDDPGLLVNEDQTGDQCTLGRGDILQLSSLPASSTRVSLAVISSKGWRGCHNGYTVSFPLDMFKELVSYTLKPIDGAARETQSAAQAN